MGQRLSPFSREAIENKRRALFRSEYSRKYSKIIDKSEKILFFIQQLIVNGYVAEYTIKFDKAGSYYRVDFAHVEKRHIIELDGEDHNSLRDKRRDERLESIGWTVSRLTYKEIEQDA